MKRNILFALIMATLVLFSACGGDAVPPENMGDVESSSEPAENPSTWDSSSAPVGNTIPGEPRTPQPVESDLTEGEDPVAGGPQPDGANQNSPRPITGGADASVTFSGKFGGESIVKTYTEATDIQHINSLLQIHPLGSEDHIFVAEDAIVITMQVQDGTDSYERQVMQATDTGRGEEVTLVRGDGSSFVAEQSVYEALLELWADVVVCR